MTAPENPTAIAPPLPGAIVDDWREIQWMPTVYRTGRRFSIPISEGDIQVEIIGCQATGGELAGGRDLHRRWRNRRRNTGRGATSGPPTFWLPRTRWRR
jgi:hypothetical protein